jgi:ABC-2 type transport system ATP-binding protein
VAADHLRVASFVLEPSGRDADKEAVQVRHAFAGYGRHREVLRGVELSHRHGDVFALLGRNGSGKTTLVSCLMGFRPLRQGSIRLLGLDPWRHRARLMRDVGYVPESPNAPAEFRIRRIERFLAALYPRWNSESLRARLDRFGIALHQRFGDLSRGQKTLVQLALALAQEPELLILDDPTLGLDPVARRFVFDELIGELAERRTTVFLTSHDLVGVERVATHVGILAEGRLIATGELDDLRADAVSAGVREPSLEEIFVARTGKDPAS